MTAKHAQCDTWDDTGPRCAHGGMDCDRVILLRHVQWHPDYFITPDLRTFELTVVSMTGAHRAERT